MEPDNVYQRLASVQAALKANKKNYNSFGKYYYRSCEDIVEAAKPICHTCGLVLLMGDEIVQIGDRYYVKATASVRSIVDGGTVSVFAFAREEETKKGMDGSQITGMASSYARKYALNGLFAIDDTKDADDNSMADRGDNTPGDGKPGKSVNATICKDCGNAITDSKRRDNTPWPAAEIEAYAMKMYQVPLCKSCLGKRYRGGKS